MRKIEEAAKLTLHCPCCGSNFDSKRCDHDNSLLYPVIEDVLIGQTIAQKYHVLDRIGEGGWSVVYRGVQRDVSRPVAIKVAHALMTQDRNKVLRFEREAQALARLKNRSVATVIDYGVLDDGRAYIVMEYVDGATLEQLISRTRISIERSVPILIEIAEAADYIHANGILHRDLKPSNILIDKDATSVKLVDFGIAKHDGFNDLMTLTHTAETLGSPAYMSPEQALGGQVDKRSDVYSFGCLMFEVLTGQKPFTGRQALETLHKHLNCDVDSFSSRAIFDVPGELEIMTRRCLAKHPADRYPSMQAVKDDLHAFTMGKRLAEFSSRGQNRTRLAKTFLAQSAIAVAFLFAAAVAMIGLSHSNKSGIKDSPVDNPVPYVADEQTLAQMKKLHFSSFVREGGQTSNFNFCDATPLGTNRSTLRPLRGVSWPGVIRDITKGPGNSVFYLTWAAGIFQQDASGETKAILSGKNCDQMAITYDETHNKIVLISRGAHDDNSGTESSSSAPRKLPNLQWTTSLQFYDPHLGTWKRGISNPGVGVVDGITYDAQDDCYYAISYNSQCQRIDRHNILIYRLDASGKVTNVLDSKSVRKPLNVQKLGGHLVCVGNYLVSLPQYGPLGHTDPDVPSDYADDVFVFDKSTAKLVFRGTIRPQYN